MTKMSFVNALAIAVAGGLTIVVHFATGIDSFAKLTWNWFI